MLSSAPDGSTTGSALDCSALDSALECSVPDSSLSDLGGSGVLGCAIGLGTGIVASLGILCALGLSVCASSCCAFVFGVGCTINVRLDVG